MINTTCPKSAPGCRIDRKAQTTPASVFIRPVIKDANKLGDLMGASSAVVFTGFIGEPYKLYPFPEKSEDFHQKPEAVKNRRTVEVIIQKYAQLDNIPITISENKGTISIGEYVFNRYDFQQVILYIWHGGVPKWKDDLRPGYVEEMMKAVISSKHWLFSDVGFGE